MNQGFTGIVTEPTYPMLRDIFIPEMKQALEEWGVAYKFNASNSIFFLDINGVETKILCMSMENVERLVGVNASWIICDEFDTTKAEISYKAFNKLLGRLRTGNVRQFVITTTPEGYRSTHRIFVEEYNDNKRLIKAKTTDNKYLPLDFVETLKSQYDSKLLKAYLEGEFVNLTSGNIFYSFNREVHHSDIVENDIEELNISQDFNIGGCVSIVYIKRGNEEIAVNEFESYDTKSIIANIKTKYPNRVINIYPDASGKNRKTNATETDIDMLRQAGFRIYVNSRNPEVEERYILTNNAFDKQILKINTKRCPKFTKALEQHGRNEKGEPEKYNQSGSIDDYTDAGTYYIAYKYPISRPTTITKLHRY